MNGSNDKEMVEMNNKFGDIVISVRHYSIIILQLIKFYFLLLADILGLGVFNLGNLQPGEILTSLRAHPRLEPVFAALGADSHHWEREMLQWGRSQVQNNPLDFFNNFWCPHSSFPARFEFARLSFLPWLSSELYPQFYELVPLSWITLRNARIWNIELEKNQRYQLILNINLI